MATTAALCVAVGSAPMPASAAPVTQDVETACNNTFSPTKFPLVYKMKTTASADPVAAGATFTVEFDVSLVASAGFLNGVYDILGSVAIPIVKNKATIAPLSGATGPAVVANMASTFTIPAPGAIPVSSGVTIPIGTVTGTYTATSGTAAFQIVGNSWAPTDTKPPGVTEAGWQGSGGSVALTTSGARTYAQASLAGGVIKPFLVCMGGTWTPSGPDYTTPLKPPTGFGAITVTGTGSSTTSTSSSTTVPGSTTTTTTDGSTTTTSTSVPESTTTSTTAPTTTTTATPPEAKEVTGSATYDAVCTTDVTPDEYPLRFVVEGTTRTNVRSGDLLDIVDQTWSVTVPGDLLGLVSSVAGKDSVDALITASVNGKNTAPAAVASDPLAAGVGPIVSSGGETQPLTVTFRPGDVRFQVTGGNAEFRMGTTKLVVTLNDALDVTLTCVAGASAEPFLISVVHGAPIATTTTTPVTATTAPSARTARPRRGRVRRLGHPAPDGHRRARPGGPGPGRPPAPAARLPDLVRGRSDPARAAAGVSMSSIRCGHEPPAREEDGRRRWHFQA
ncbi:hypothetical protein ACE2AJ_19875 [Aquihabitans daechungensis]|uniref:hypothetical protein n=1 Tax=Aquihabitans daechungensis TaxID=1052257 RepID=UPI003BA32022